MGCRRKFRRSAAVLVALAALALWPSLAGIQTASALTVGGFPVTPITASPVPGHFNDGEYVRVYAIHLGDYQSLAVTLTASPGSAMLTTTLFLPSATSIWPYGGDFVEATYDNPDNLNSWHYEVPAGAGGTYYLAVGAWNWHELFHGGDYVLTYSTPAPAGPITGLTGSPSSSTHFETPPWQVSLHWANPSDSTYVKTVLARCEGTEWSDADAESVYEGTGTSFLDTVPSDGSAYVYGAYSVSRNGARSTPTTVAVDFPSGGPNDDVLPGVVIGEPSLDGFLGDDGSGTDSVDVYRVPLEAGQTFSAWTYATMSAQYSTRLSDLIKLDVKLLGPEATSLTSPVVATATKPHVFKWQWPTDPGWISGLQPGRGRGFPYVVTYTAPRTGVYHLVVRRTNNKDAHYLLESWVGKRQPFRVTLDSAKMVATGWHGSFKHLDVWCTANGPIRPIGAVLQVKVGGKWTPFERYLASDSTTASSRVNFVILRSIVDRPKLVWKHRYNVRVLVPAYGLATSGRSSTVLSR